VPLLGCPGKPAGAMCSRRCLSCSVGIFAVLVGPVYLEQARRVSPLFLADLNSHEKGFQDFVLETVETLRSKRVIGSVLVKEVLGNKWLEDGLILDVGVFLGSSTRTLAGLLGNRTTVHGFDTFSGFPEGKVWKIDDFDFESKFQHNETWVQTLIAEQGLDFTDGKPSTLGFNVEYHRGLSFDTLPKVLDAHPDKPVKFLHVDIDTYEGALGALEDCRKRMIVGTTIVFDDFFILNSEFKAFFEFQRRHSFQYTWTAWGHDVGFMNAVSPKSWLAFVWGYNVFKTKMWQLSFGLRWSASWADYFILVTSFFNNAAGLRITGIGNLHDD